MHFKVRDGKDQVSESALTKDLNIHSKDTSWWVAENDAPQLNDTNSNLITSAQIELIKKYLDLISQTSYHELFGGASVLGREGELMDGGNIKSRRISADSNTIEYMFQGFDIGSIVGYSDSDGDSLEDRFVSIAYSEDAIMDLDNITSPIISAESGEIKDYIEMTAPTGSTFPQDKNIMLTNLDTGLDYSLTSNVLIEFTENNIDYTVHFFIDPSQDDIDAMEILNPQWGEAGYRFVYFKTNVDNPITDLANKTNLNALQILQECEDNYQTLEDFF